MRPHTHNINENPSRDTSHCDHHPELCCRDCCDLTTMSLARLAALTGTTIEEAKKGRDELVKAGFLQHVHGDTYRMVTP